MAEGGLKENIQFFIHDNVVFQIPIDPLILFSAPARRLRDVNFILNHLELSLFRDFGDHEGSGLENVLLKFLKILKSFQKAFDCFSNPLGSVTKILIGHDNEELDIFDFGKCSVVKIAIADHLAAST